MLIAKEAKAMSNIKIAVAQVPCFRGNVTLNIDTHIKAIKKAAQLGVSYLVFPELSLTGYAPELALELAFTLEDKRLKPLIESAISNNIIVAVGAPIASQGLPHIGLMIISQTGELDVYSKMNLHPGEELYFSKGDKHHCVTIDNLKIANAICADANQAEHVAYYSKADAQVYIMGSLITAGGYESDTEKMVTYAKKYKLLVAMANHIEPTGDWLPIGKSAIWSDQGLLACASETGSALVVAERVADTWTAKVIEIHKSIEAR